MLLLNASDIHANILMLGIHYIPYIHHVSLSLGQHMLFLWKSPQLVRYFCSKKGITFTKDVWLIVFLIFFTLLVEITGDYCMAENLGVIQVHVHCLLSIIGN